MLCAVFYILCCILHVVLCFVTCVLCAVLYSLSVLCFCPVYCAVLFCIALCCIACAAQSVVETYKKFKHYDDKVAEMQTDKRAGKMTTDKQV